MGQIAGGIIFIGMIKLKHILKEDEVEDNFGKVAFGEDPRIAKLQGISIRMKDYTGGEENTPYERELLDTLKSWVNQSSDRTADVLYSKFPILKKAAKVFPQVLLPETPNGTLVYRGLLMSNQKLLDMIHKTKREDWEIGETIKNYTMFRYVNPISYTPNRPVQSWSTDSKLVTSFFYESGMLLSTKQTDEFLFNQNLMKYLFNKSNDFSGGKDEREILHFGKNFKEDVYLSITEKLWLSLFAK